MTQELSPEDPQRKAFEAWMQSDGTLPLERDGDSHVDMHTALMWHAWQHVPPERPAPVEKAAPSALDPNETDPTVLWAEIARLQAAVAGPDGYASWQEAATAERVRRVRAERALSAQQAAQPVAERDALRSAQSAAVMPMIGPLLDAWECCSQSVREEHPELDTQLRRINRAMESTGDALDAQPVAGEPVVPAEPVLDERATWWSLVMGSAASLENASACLRDPDAKRAATGAAKHYRERAQAIYTAAAAPAGPVQLTDEQIDEEWFDVHTLPVNNVAKARLFARAVVAKFCEVNGIKAGTCSTN